MIRSHLLYIAPFLVACASRAAVQQPELAIAASEEPATAAPPASYWEPFHPPSDAGPHDSARLSTDLCGPGIGTGERIWFDDLKLPQGPPEYVELRIGEQRMSGGWRCRTAADPVACEREFRALPLPLRAALRDWQLVVGRSGHFRVLTTPPALLAELGRIDTLPEAALWLKAAGYELACRERFRISGEARQTSWLVYAVWSTEVPDDSGPTQWDSELRHVEVSATGQIRVLERTPFSE